MAAKDSTSMSALGQFYDAVLAVSEDQAKKYGKSAKPDFVPGAISDEIAENLTTIGGIIGSGEASVKAVSDHYVNYGMGKLTIGKLNLNQVLPIALGEVAPTITYSLGSTKPDTASDKSIGGSADLGYEAALKVEYANPNDLINDPRGAISKGVDAYAEEIQKIRKAKLIAGVGEALQEAANYQIMRNDNVPKDIASAVVNASLPNTKVGMAYGGETIIRVPPTPIKDMPEAVALDPIDIGKRSAKDSAKAVPVVDSVMGTALGMYTGILNEKERDEFAKYTKEALLKDVAAEFNTQKASSPTVKTLGPATVLYDLFGHADPTTSLDLASMNKSQMFNAGSSGTSLGDVIQSSFMSALSKKALDPSTSPTLKANIQKLHAKVMNDDEAFDLFKELGKSVKNGTVDGSTRPANLGGFVKLGMNKLAVEVNAKGDASFSNTLIGTANRIGKYDGQLSPAEKISYGLARYASLPTMDKWLTPAMFMVGDAGGFAGLINGLGGIMGTGTLGATAPFLGIQMFGVFGDDNKKLFQLDSSGGKNASRILKWAYAFDEPAKESVPDPKNPGKTMKVPRYKKNADGSFQIDKNGNKIQDMDRTYNGAAPSWGKINWTIPESANPFQKAAYSAYVYHPVNIAKGFLNGTLYQHRIHIQSNFGAMYKNKEISKIFKSSTFGNAVANNDKKGVKQIKDFLFQRYQTTGDKDFLRASKVLGTLQWMNRPGYKFVVKRWEMLNKWIGLPGQMQKRAMELAKRAALKAARAVAVKIGAKVALEAVLATATAGASLLASRGYAIANFVTFGLLDKVVFGTLKFTLEMVVGIIVGVVALLVMFGGIVYVTFPTMVTMGMYIGGGGSYVPDSGYFPVLTIDYGTGEYGDEYTGPLPNPIIDWEDYEKYSENDCPLQVGGSPVRNCTQGPRGTWSHAGNGGHYAIDMAQAGTAVYAPVGGVAVADNIQCLTSCDKTMSYVSYNRAEKLAQCKAYVARYGSNVLGFKWQGDDGKTYRFWHSFFNSSLKYGQHYDKGQLLGIVVEGASACSTGTHIHFEVLGDQNPDVAYMQMCKIGSMQCQNQ